MKQPIRVATSPLTNTIYAGRVRGNLWQGDKHDVTVDALAAVAEHALAFGKPIVITKSGVPEFEITVKRLGNNGN
jgi:hypothetical protein